MSDLIIAEVLHGLRLNSWHEAADLIEQLQQRIAELEQHNNELAATVERLIKAGNELLEAIDTHLEAIKGLEQ